MQSLYIELKTDGEFALLRYRSPEKLEFETKSLNLAEINDLYGFADRDFETRIPDLGSIGRRLFAWLDGDGRWLSQETETARGLLVLAIDCDSSASLTASAQLAGLPWETMQDGKGFLVNRCIVPVRVIGGFNSAYSQPQVSQYRLQTLFMATDPENVEPKLDYEGEESRILAATQDLAIELRVEESGCLSELTSLWRRFDDDYFQVFHLSGHASIQNNQPYFITESLTGDRVNATVDDFDRVFQLRYPRLMFLSGCRTGQTSDGGAVPSLAASLVERGATAVLGWARPVSDVGATQAATELYRSLAQGLTIAEALGLTYQALLRDNVRDWCLLRLYARVDAWGELVLPPGDVMPARKPEPKLRFLDHEGLVRVAGADEFVGRRRYLQRGLRELKSSQNLGIWLHGIGGVGKSTIACRLLDRFETSGYTPLVRCQVISQRSLLDMSSRGCETEKGHEILNGKLPLAQKLSQFLKSGLNHPDQRYLFILDDFEANLEDRGDGLWVLKAAVVEPLNALLWGISNSGLPHRVIITSRYDVKLPEFDRQLARLQVERLDRSDVEKKYQRLAAFQTGAKTDRDLQTQAKEIADGYPRLLEWLDKVLRDDLTDSAAILVAMDGKKQEFLEDILAAQLLAQQEPDLRAMLARGMVFELPVPVVALRAICEGIGGLDRHLERARSLGLLEAGLNEAVRVPRVLGITVAENMAELAAIGVKELYREWWENAKSPSEEWCVELHRLALVAGNAEIAVEMARGLSDHWIVVSRYREALTVCKDTLLLQSDSRIIYNLAKIYEMLGDWEKSSELAHQSLSIDREIGDRQSEAMFLSQIATIYTKQGKWHEALQSCQNALSIALEIGNRHGESELLHQIAIIYTNQDKWNEALKFCQDSLSIKCSTDDYLGVAASLYQIAKIYITQNKWSEALQSCQNALFLDRKIGNRQGEALCLHQIAKIHINQNKWSEALQSCQDALFLDLEIGNRQGEAASLDQMGYIASKQGDIAQAEQYYLASAQVKGEIRNYSGLITSLRNLGFTVKTKSLTYLAQALWLTLRLATNLQSTIELIERIYQQVPPGNPLEALLGATALYFCQDSPHPDRSSLQEHSFNIISHAAQQQGITTQAAFEDWFVQNRLDDPNYFLPALDGRLREMIGDDWLFDPHQMKSPSSDSIPMDSLG